MTHNAAESTAAYSPKDTTEPLALAWFKDQQVKKQVAEMLSGMGLDEYTVEGQAIRRFSSPLEQIDRMLPSLEARRITFERAREIAQADLDLARVRRAKVALIERACTFGELEPPQVLSSVTQNDPAP